LEISGIGEEPFRGVFIRAPIIKKVGSRAEILAECNGDPVLVKQGNCLAATFHPELTEDMRLHKLFLDI
jgi:5'-phosphate synthase pdxT subunit